MFIVVWNQRGYCNFYMDNINASAYIAKLIDDKTMFEIVSYKEIHPKKLEWFIEKNNSVRYFRGRNYQIIQGVQNVRL